MANKLKYIRLNDRLQFNPGEKNIVQDWVVEWEKVVKKTTTFVRIKAYNLDFSFSPEDEPGKDVYIFFEKERYNEAIKNKEVFLPAGSGKLELKITTEWAYVDNLRRGKDNEGAPILIHEAAAVDPKADSSMYNGRLFNRTLAEFDYIAKDPSRKALMKIPLSSCRFSKDDWGREPTLP